MTTLRQTNSARRDGMVWALSAHYIMLIRPQQVLPLVRIYWKLFIFKYIFKIYRTLVALCDSYQEKENDQYIFLTYWILYRKLYFGNYRWPKLTKLHRTKERHTPSLSNQTSVYTLLPEGGVVWNLRYYLWGGGGEGEIPGSSEM